MSACVPDRFYLLEVANLLLLRMEQLTKRMLADPAPMEIDTSVLPSGEKASDQIQPRCPRNR
jgi:hypothetical protein